MDKAIKNIFQDIPHSFPDEIITSLLETKSVRIERILSKGHFSPTDFWYDQDEHEWIIVLEGMGVLEFKDDSKTVEMLPGDFFFIPANKKHRVSSTDNSKVTIWLAIFFN